METNKHATLCWRCAKACGKCSWSDGSFVPVKGWKAEPTKIWVDHSPKYSRREGKRKDRYLRRIDSFRVIECPEFVSDKDQYKMRDDERAWY
jgi:hypothetical protein